jgi:hypothetical protein
MVAPTNRLLGLGSMAGPILGQSVSSILGGVGTLAKTGGAGLASAGKAFGTLAEGVLGPLGERGLGGLTKIPRAMGRLGMRRPVPEKLSRQGGLLGGNLGGALGKLGGWEASARSMGKGATSLDQQLQSALQKAQNALQTVSSITKATHEIANAVIRNMQ